MRAQTREKILRSLRYIGLCALTCGALSTWAQYKVSLPPELVGIGAQQRVTFKMPRPALEDITMQDLDFQTEVGQGIALFYKDPAFDDALSLGDARINECAATTCSIQLSTSRTLKLFPIRRDSELLLYPVVASEAVITLIEDGKLPKNPNIGAPQKHALAIEALFHVANLSMNENPDPNFNAAKFTRRRANEVLWKVIASWRNFELGYETAKANLPTQGFFGDHIQSNTASSRYYLLYDWHAFSILSVIGGLAKENETFTTENNNDAIIPSTTNNLALLTGVGLETSRCFIGTSTSSFRFKIGSLRLLMQNSLKASVTDAGPYRRGDSSSLHETKFILLWKMHTEGSNFWKNLWTYGIGAEMSSASLSFTGTTNPPSYPQATSYQPSSNRFFVEIGKKYVF